MAKIGDLCDAVATALIKHVGGLNRKMLAFHTGIPEEYISKVVAAVRDRSDQYGDVLVTIRRGGEYIYAWATLVEDWEEHEIRRLKYRRRSALRSEKVAEQAHLKFQTHETYAGWVAAKHERENAEVMLARLSP